MKLKPPAVSDGLKKRTQVKFLGYDALGTEGAICDMENLTSDYYPELAARPRRYRAETLETPRGMGAGGALCRIDGTTLYYGDTAVENAVEDSDTVRTFVQLGDYVTIWPDKLAYDTVTGTVEPLEASVTGGSSADQRPLLLFDSREYEESTQANVMFMWGADMSVFRVGDAVTISGCVRHPNNNRTVVIRRIVTEGIVCSDDTFEMDEYLTMLVGADGLEAGVYFVGEAATLGDEYICTLPAMTEGDTLMIDVADVWAGTLTATATISGVEQTIALTEGEAFEKLTFAHSWSSSYFERNVTVTVRRQAPDMSVVFAHDNRLFGLSGDTVYVSKLGDPFNWNVYEGVSTDSWTTDTGTPGVFTGGISYGGYPRFFKEDRVFTLYGGYPAEYELVSRRALGVAQGSEKSLAVGNGRLYYLSPQGVCVYAGGDAALLADAFGTEKYHGGVGASDDVKYYISMQGEDGGHNLFVYDIAKGLWMREDDGGTISMCHFNGAVWRLGADGHIDLLGRPSKVPAGAAEEGDIAWYAEFGDITLKRPEKKRITKLLLRLEPEAGAAVTVKIKYDSGDDWRTVSSISAGRKRSVLLPVVPRRLDHFRVRLEGTGGCRISSMSFETERGSDR